MTTFVALTCTLFVFYLFWTDHKKTDWHASLALSIPLAWMFLAGSRYASSWLDLGAGATSRIVYDEGSPIDATVFFLLMLAGIIVLRARKIDWGQILTHNRWVLLYFVFCGVSAIWSDVPATSLKRLIKDSGNLIMVLLILTEERPYEAVGIILRRLAYLLLPLSLVFIRYYPDLGRTYALDGVMLFTGAGHQKNSLGLMCLTSGIYFSWKFFVKGRGYFRWEWKDNLRDLIFIGMIVWLLLLSNSVTSTICLVVGTGVFLIGGSKWMAQRPGRIVVWITGAAFVAVLFEIAYGVRDFVLESFGRDTTLTNRTVVWDFVKEMGVDPILGTGYMSFWSGERMTAVWKKFGVGIIQAHSGYLEQYLNLGILGLVFIGVLMLSGLLKVRRHLSVDYSSALLRLCLIVIAGFYNYTEAAFYGINNMWILLLIGVIEVPRSQGPAEELEA